MSDEPNYNDADLQDAAPLTGDAHGVFDPSPNDYEAPSTHGFATIPPDEPLEAPRMSEDGWPILFDDAPAGNYQAQSDDASAKAFAEAVEEWSAFQASDATAMPNEAPAQDPFVAAAAPEQPAPSKRKRRRKKKAARAEAAAKEQANADAQVNNADASSAPLSGAFTDQNSAYAAPSFDVSAAQSSTAPNYDFLWESDEATRKAKGDAGTTTVVESDTDYLLLPHPDVFNAYPPEVQRKIMEWADRDVRARRDDESLRQDALIRAQAARERTMMAVPVAIIILCIVCATITGLFTRSAAFVVAFLVVAVAIILALYFTRKNDLYAHSDMEDEEESEQ